MSNEYDELIQSDINAIKRYDIDIQKTYFYIARRLYELKESNYLDKTNFKGYKNIYDLALNEFGYEASKVRYLISIYLKFFKTETEETCKNGVTTKWPKKSIYCEYSISQLRYMVEMTDEQLKRCNSSMTVKEIKEIKLNVGTRVPAESIERPENLKNNNVIEGVFLEKKEEIPEEKVNTIIVTELPKEQQKENKTIVVDVKTEQNDDYAINQDIALEAQQDYYKNKYHEALEEIQVLQENIANENKKIQDYKNKVKEVSDTLVYFHDELLFINSDLKNEKLEKYVKEFFEFVFNAKLPKKVYFMKHVI